MTKEEAIEALEQCVDWAEHTGRRYVDTVPADALKMALEALQQSEVKCLECDYLKSCMYAWDVDCGCEFFKMNGEHSKGE